MSHFCDCIYYYSEKTVKSRSMLLDVSKNSDERTIVFSKIVVQCDINSNLQGEFQVQNG